ncbi:MAG: hypothetical protein AAFV53_19250, partial [Myxococcota bacterium]
ETDDRLHHSGGITGPMTLIRAQGVLWQPFDPRGPAHGREQVLRKAAEGHWLELEERAPDLGLVFRQRWVTGPRFGLIRRCRLEGNTREVEVLDGLLNLIPAGVPALAQQGLSTLVDAYKRNELLPSGLALYAMDALLSDQAAPAEALRANVVWRCGLADAQTTLSEQAVQDMRAGRPTPDRDLYLGERGAYFVRATVNPSEGPIRWDIVGEVHLDHIGVAALIQELASIGDLDAAISADIADNARQLRQNIASADGMQHTADRAAVVHHFANVTFNNMRGGVPAHDHDVLISDFIAFLEERNRPVADRHRDALADLGEHVPHPALVAHAEATGDDHVVRLCMEYLPIIFSRRHGDPSRPWNAFSIRIRHPDGSLRYSYEGNWRDIFQNWEALCLSFPRFLVPIIAKFVNASTIDGFNPYRLTRTGVDWERPDPDDPWANIGYWGDHQIVYLYRLLESAEAHEPGCIRALMSRDLFSFADVPYRIRPYAALVQDAKDTIVFDHDADQTATTRAATIGGDGWLVPAASGDVHHVNLLEKLLIPVLAKLSNLVVDGGIWLNTQRPEWNDANNALVGQGLSMVTLAQLRRALAFLRDLVSDAGAPPVSTPVITWFNAVASTLADHSPLQTAGDAPISAVARRALLDRLGQAFSDYREAVYARPVTDRAPLDTASVAMLCDDALLWLDHSLKTNRLESGLYHSYNLLTLTDGGAQVGHLYEMLEGQVAVLGSGVLDPAGAVALLDALFHSDLYREDQRSFMLYPFRDRPRFMDRNVVPHQMITENPALTALAQTGRGGILEADANGTFRFNADFENATSLAARLDADEINDEIREAALAAYEATFDHHAFTGRSGTMYKYEGLGSIYWHMVSKLLVSTQEAWRAADAIGAPEAGDLAEAYYRVRRGLSFNKDINEYGAFPTDPYSHTPRHLGAQQPGMTGQVKEEVITRMGELGVQIAAGQLRLSPHLLRRRELLPDAQIWRCVTATGEHVDVAIPANAIAFTLCQVPVVLEMIDGPPEITVNFADGSTQHCAGRTLDVETTRAITDRNGKVTSVTARMPQTDLTLD